MPLRKILSVPFVFFAAALSLALMPFAAGAATISSGYSGNWYDPARSGEGLQLEILSSDVALVEWYTYDSQGKQRWIQGVGNIAGNSIQFPQAYTTQGGKFGLAFNPDEVKVTAVGNMSLTFGDCNTGTFKYTAFGQTQTLPIQRLTQTMGAGCQSINGVPGEPVMSYAGQSGSWYNTTRSGEGFDLQWLANGAALVTWYTYDANGNQVWLLGVGSQQGNAIVFDQMAITNGPKFGAAYNKADLQQDDWGSLTLTLDCNGGTAHYASKQAAFGSGDLTLTRLTHLRQPACPYVQPKFGDLYDITWNVVPLPEGTSTDPNAIMLDSIANDGTIAGRRDGHLVLWHPDSQTWEDIQRDLATYYAPVFISPDGLSVIATDASDSVLLWKRSTDWQVIPDAQISGWYPTSISRNFEFLSGPGPDLSDVWVVGIDGGQRTLQGRQNYFDEWQIVHAISNDGNTAIESAPIYGYPLYYAYSQIESIRWRADMPPALLESPAGENLAYASACDANCNIVFGSGLTNSPDGQSDPNEAWYLKQDGTFGHLGSIDGAYYSSHPYFVTGLSPDGTFAIGLYEAQRYPGYDESPIVMRPFVWTQATGILPLATILSEMGIDIGIAYPGDVSVPFDIAMFSADGNTILLRGMFYSDKGEPTVKVFVLHLMPKALSN